MAKLKLEFTLNRHIGLVAPGCRFWVDLDRDGSHEDKERVREVEQEGLSWTGVVDVDEELGTITAFVRYIASPGATWKVKASLGDRQIVNESGEVTDPVSWVHLRLKLKGGAT